LEKILDHIYTMEDPNYAREKVRELDDFVKRAEREEAERIRLGKPIHKALKQEPSLKNTPEKEESEEPKQTSGGINLAYLAKEEENDPTNFQD